MKRIAFVPIISLVLALSALFAGSAASPSKTLATSSVFQSVPNGYGYAVYVITSPGSSSLNYGPSVPIWLSCTTPPTTNTLTNSGATLPASSLIGSGTAVSTITLNRTASSDTVQTSEDIHSLRLLGGLIAANDVYAQVSSTATATGATSTNSSSFSRLTIAGLAVNRTPAPNTTKTLPGFGSVILNEQSGPSNGSQASSIGVVMMDIRTGGETSTASGQMTASSAAATAQNGISNVNLFNGFVSADRVATVASAAWNGTGSRSGSATFVNASIDGSPLPSNLSPNTRKNLAGIGYVIINEQVGSNNALAASEAVIGMDINITVANNPLGLPVGARIIVSCASTGAADY